MRARCTGTPGLRLLRRQVEALVKKKHGKDYLKEQQAKTALARINRELKRLTTLAAKEGLAPDELLGRLISCWRHSKA